MPTERLSMRRIRDLLRLRHAQGLGKRAIALSLGLGKGTQVFGIWTCAPPVALTAVSWPVLQIAVGSPAMRTC